MGRIKRGLDYFPLSTSFMYDRMVRRIMKREGDSAFAILVETLSYIYAGKGYYVFGDDEFYDELADNLYSTELDDVKRVIGLAVEYGLFDAGLFRQYNILTSADIQRQYLFITKRRSSSLIEPEYALLEAEEMSSYRFSQKNRRSAAVACTTTDAVTPDCDAATITPEMNTLSTQNKGKQTKTNQSKITPLPNPPEGENDGGKFLKKRTELTQEDVDGMQPPCDEVQRNFLGLMENLRLYKIPPSEQYAIILKSNFGAIGNAVWKGFNTIWESSGKIKLPGHYLLSVMN